MSRRIFPPGTQGDTSGLPVDIIGDMIVVLNANWQVVWYWDVFDPASGGNGYAELPVSRTAPLGETCGKQLARMPADLPVGSRNIAPLAHDWLHANSPVLLAGSAGWQYHWQATSSGPPGTRTVSSRSITKTARAPGNILWRMGPTLDGASGDFAFHNIYSRIPGRGFRTSTKSAWRTAAPGP